MIYNERCQSLEDKGLDFMNSQAFVTLRRLTVAVNGIPEIQPDVREERRGPRVDAPKSAIDGFLGSVGLQSTSECEQRETDKGIFLFVVSEKKGQQTIDIIPELVISAISNVTAA